MMRHAAAVGIAALLMSARLAKAHTVIDGIGGFPGGLLHPLLVPSHGLALIALGCLVSRRDGRGRIWMIAAFPAGMIVATIAVALAYSAANAELIVLGLAALIGLLLASGWRIPDVIIALVSATTGGAILFDSVPAVPSVCETLAGIAGTALAATLLLTCIVLLSAAAPALWQRIGIRILGSWITASAVMVLALRFVR